VSKANYPLPHDERSTLEKRIKLLEEKLSLLEKKTRSKLDYLLKEIQQLRKVKD